MIFCAAQIRDGDTIQLLECGAPTGVPMYVIQVARSDDQVRIVFSYESHHGSLADILLFELDETTDVWVSTCNETVLVQEAWIAAGGNPEVRASKQELIELLNLLVHDIEAWENGNSGMC